MNVGSTEFIKNAGTGLAGAGVEKMNVGSTEFIKNAGTGLAGAGVEKEETC